MAGPAGHAFHLDATRNLFCPGALLTFFVTKALFFVSGEWQRAFDLLCLLAWFLPRALASIAVAALPVSKR